MIAYVGTLNPMKLASVAAVCKRDPRLVKLGKIEHVRGFKVTSAVAAQPRTLDETIRGAIHRAKRACLYAEHDVRPQESLLDVVTFGLESGVFDRVYEVDGSHRTVMFDVTVCAIVGRTGQVGIGMSPAWIVPDDFANAIRGHGLEMDDAYARFRPEAEAHIGQRGGLVGECSDGITTRQMLTEAAIEMALIGLVL